MALANIKGKNPTQADLQKKAFFLPIKKVALVGENCDDGKDVLPVLKEYGTRAAVTDLCILRGCFVNGNYYVNNDENNLSARTGSFWSASSDHSSFVLGNITTCCQRYDEAARECVKAGYENPNAGFLVFRQGEKIIGQAWTWYDPVTKTVCLDNVEVPKSILSKMSKQGEFGKSSLMDAILLSAKGLADSMNEKGVEVREVTTGKGYNDLASEFDGLQERCKDLARIRDYNGYSDARASQFVLYKKGSDILGKRALKAMAGASRDLYAVTAERTHDRNEDELRRE